MVLKLLKIFKCKTILVGVYCQDLQDADRVEMNEHPNANDAGEQERVNIIAGATKNLNLEILKHET